MFIYNIRKCVVTYQVNEPISLIIYTINAGMGFKNIIQPNKNNPRSIKIISIGCKLYDPVVKLYKPIGKIKGRLSIVLVKLNHFCQLK